MQRIGDDRVCFVARKDELAHPYMFLRPNGDVNYYNWCSVSQRRNLGNILKDSLPVVMSKSEDLRIDLILKKVVIIQEIGWMQLLICRFGPGFGRVSGL